MMLDTELFAYPLLDVVRAYVTFPLFWPHLMLMAVGLFVTLAGLGRYASGFASNTRARSCPDPSLRPTLLGWGLVIGWSVIYCVAYTLLGVGVFQWYYAPVAPALVALIGLGAQWLADGLRAREIALLRPTLAWLAPLILLATLGSAHLPAIRHMARTNLGYHHMPEARYRERTNDHFSGLYRVTGEWLRENTPATASVGTPEIGIIGYYSQRRIIDFACMLQPDLAALIQQGTTFDDLTLHAANTYQPGFMAMLDGFAPRIVASERFQRACSEIKRLRHESLPGAVMIIYSCTWSAADGHG
jgi:hypothetical protein